MYISTIYNFVFSSVFTGRNIHNFLHVTLSNIKKKGFEILEILKGGIKSSLKELYTPLVKFLSKSSASSSSLWHFGALTLG